jgi:Flp pilus assembly protein TadG
MTFWRMTTLLRHERGAAIIELALVAPILALTVIGIVDMSNAYSRKLALEQAAQRAVEKIGQTTETATVEATLANEAVCQVNGTTTTNGVTTCNSTPITTSNVTVTWSLECTDSGGTTSTQSTTDSATYDAFTCGGGTVSQARYLQVTVNDKYYPLFPIHFAHFTGSGSTGYYPISASAGMRTS